MVLVKEEKYTILFSKFSLADFVTLINAFAGTISILFCLNYLGNDRKLPYITMSFWCFPISFIADFLDGIIARSTGSSIYGADLDSLADVVSFGIAPAVLGFTLDLKGMWDSICLGFYVICGISRLARYNTISTLSKVKYYRGLPIPGGLGLVLLLAIDNFLMNSFLVNYGNIKIFSKDFRPLSLLYVIFGLLMISNIKFRKWP